MKRLLSVSLLSLTAAGSSLASDQPTLGYQEAEEFVHGNLYSGMLQVWSEDRRAWNALLSVHACGGEQQQEKLTTSYESAQPLFSRAMVNLAQTAALFETPSEQDILMDVAQTAYRLFSASYAHGYARQVEMLGEIDSEIRGELCGTNDVPALPENVEYPVLPSWKVSVGDTAPQHEAIQDHAIHGYTAFNRLLKQQYAQFDALVYSHAYQNTDAYEVLFFEVNRFENVQAYQQGVNELAEITEQTQGGAGDFAYLVLSSGYHWGTLSVLAMLEEEYPRLHTKARDKATKHIERITKPLQEEKPQDHG